MIGKRLKICSYYIGKHCWVENNVALNFAVEYCRVWGKGKVAIKAHTNLSLGKSGPSIANTEDEALGVAALNHSTKGEEELSYTNPCCQNTISPFQFH